MTGVEMMWAYSDLTDALIRRVYELAIEEAEVDSPMVRRAAARHVAIGAVGGYGRREMSPFSDVDVAFVVGGEEDAAIDLVVKRAFRKLMDVLDTAALKVGYSYRRVDEVQNLPLEAQTALLDARCIIGSVSLFNTFEAALGKAIVPAAFVVGHIDGRRGRGSTDTPFVVEPDIKEGHGGLRDLHASRWISQVAFGLAGDCVWDGLRARGILLDSELDETHASVEFLSRARNALHLLTGRGMDVLSMSRHAEIAERLGFPGPQEFISQYYACAHVLWRVFHKVASACRQADLEIEPGIIARDGRLHILDRGLLGRDAAALLRVFQHAQSYHLRIARETSDMLIEAAKDYKLSTEASQTFVDILSQPGVAAALRSMAEMGVLQAVIPQFGELMYLVPGDAAHQFTVGEHSLRAVEQLEGLLSEGNEQFADIFSRIQHLDVLFLAALVHDIGKLDSSREHAKSGAFRSAKIASQLGMPGDAGAKVEFLVRNHLKMGETARLRDLQQPKTIKDFVSVVRDSQLLDMLFLLTIADFRAVGTSHWSQVQTRFLLELHERASAALRSPDSPGPDLERHRSRVRRELCLANLPVDEIDEHCASMPASYLLNTPPETLAAHIGYVRSVRDGSPAVEIKDDREGAFTLLTVIAMDRPGLLSRIAGVMHALNVDIHAAQIFTRHSTDDIAIDTLFVDYEGRQLTEMKKWQVEGELVNVLGGSYDVSELLRRMNRGEFKKLGDMTLRALENLSDHETVLEIRAIDCPGLLHYFTSKVAELGWSIHSARVATWGHEAHDVFYVTDGSGAELSDRQIVELHEAVGA